MQKVADQVVVGNCLGVAHIKSPGVVQREKAGTIYQEVLINLSKYDSATCFHETPLAQWGDRPKINV